MKKATRYARRDQAAGVSKRSVAAPVEKSARFRAPVPAAPPRHAFATLGGPVEIAGDPLFGRSLAGLFAVDPDRPWSLTHGFHPYAARLHPSIAAGAIAEFSVRGDVVLDPFCGSGTVLIEAMVAGRRPSGSDASPLAVELSRARTDPMDGRARGRLVEIARAVAAESAGRAEQRIRLPGIPAWARAVRPGFAPHVFLELLGLRTLVFEAASASEDERIARALRLCLSSILSKYEERGDPAAGDAPSRVGPNAGLDRPKKRIARGLPSRFFAARVEELVRALGDLERAAGDFFVPRIACADACVLPEVADGSVDLIVTSPPYAGVYDYASMHAVRYAFLNLPREEFSRVQVGPPERGFGAHAEPWRRARRSWLAAMHRVLRPGGRALLAVGDGVLGRRPEDALTETREAARVVGLTPLAGASEPRSPNDRRLRAIFGRTPRREHLILFEKR